MQLEGKRIIVIGAANGCGAAAVRAFVGVGATVAALDVLDEDGKKVVSEANEQGAGSAFYHHCDVSSRREVHSVFTTAVQGLGGLDALVNAAAISRQALPETMEDEQWELIMGINLRGTFIANQEAFPYFREGGGGRILNFGSGSSFRPHPHAAHYAASKGGVVAWTRSIAYAWGRYGITANVVQPAMTGTLMASQAAGARAALGEWVQREYEEQRLKTSFPLGDRRFPPTDEDLPPYHGDPDTDLAPVLVFLVGDGARFITAQVIAVDGGGTPLR